MPSREEILKALQTIKSVCEEHDCCETCPFRVYDEDCYGDYGCTLRKHDNPAEWKIKSREENWRAFED